jgi:very-short-patch-repair endonuclease
MTAAEQILWRKLRAHRFNGFAFRRQVPIGRYIGDFVCLARRVVIEVDGATHSRAAETAADRQREDWLRRQGFRVRRYQNVEITQNIEGVLSDLESLLADPPLQLSPARGRGHPDKRLRRLASFSPLRLSPILNKISCISNRIGG